MNAANFMESETRTGMFPRENMVCFPPTSLWITSTSIVLLIRSNSQNLEMFNTGGWGNCIRSVLSFSTTYSKGWSIGHPINHIPLSSLTVANNPFRGLPSWVSDGMSNSNSIINHHHLISLCLYNWDCNHLLWMMIEKEDLINQSSFHLYSSW